MNTHPVLLIDSAQCGKCAGMIFYSPWDPRHSITQEYAIAECRRCEVLIKIPLRRLDAEVVPESNAGAIG